MSAEHQSLLLDHSSGILLLVDAESLTIAEANKTAFRLLGYQRDELLGRSITDVECGLADTAFWEEVRSDGARDVSGIESSYRRADGTMLQATRTVVSAPRGGKIWLVVRAEPVRSGMDDEDGVDLASRLRATLEATAEGILLVDRLGRIINMNRRFARIWGLPDALLLAHDDSLVFGFMAGLLADPAEYHEKLAAISPEADGESFDVLHLADGRVFERRSMPARSERHIFGRVFSFADITERRRTESARDELQMQLRESQKMEALGALAGGVAHDFNNIVATIMGNTELAALDIEPGHPALESLAEIRKASQRAKELVRQILAFGRRQPLKREVGSLESVVLESARLMRSMLPAGVALGVECLANAPPVLADANQIQQVLMNLCGNAWQALQGQERPGVIDVRLEGRTVAGGGCVDNERRVNSARTNIPPGRYACLIVRDNGRGMDAKTRARIFEPFFTTKPVGEGTGLGLSVVHSIVKDHDAHIEVRSSPGEGATFCIYFPAQETPGGVPAALETRRIDTPAGVPGEGAEAAPRRVLYVDDDESIVFLMTRLLQRRGYRVSGYVDPRMAIVAVRADPGQFDLVITDNNMPGMSGLDVVRSLREIRADLPVALASGFITDELRAQAQLAGVSELIYKPNTVDELCDAVARLAGTLR